MSVETQTENVRRESRAGGCLLFAVAIVSGLPLLALCGLTLFGPPSAETFVFSLAVLVFVVASILAPWRRTRPFVFGSLVLALAVIGYRFFAASEGTSVRAWSGDGVEDRWTDRIVPERDVALGGSMLLLAAGLMPPRQPGLLDALRDGYSRMEQSEGPVPSAVISTFVFGQHPDAHSTLRVVPPARFERPESAVVFLHGFIGSVTVECWQVAQAATSLGMDVVCPATEWRARWTRPEGRETVVRTIAALRQEGVRRIYLAGLSAGAIGASRLARRLDIQGLVLISGADPRAVPPRVPVLVLQGARDQMTRAGPARAYAARAHAEYREHPDASHWLILSHYEWTDEHLRRWLAAREGLGAIEVR